MRYKIKNMTYSPLRVVMDGKDVRLDARKYTFLDTIDDSILTLERKKLIKIRQIK